MSESEWNPVPELDNVEISRAGGVRCFWNIAYTHQGSVKVPTETPRTVNQHLGSTGYFYVAITTAPKVHRHYYVHRMVLAAFVGPCPENHEGCHRNGNRTDNRAENLYWGTRKDNCLDTSRHGRNRKSKLTPDQVGELVRLFDSGVKQVELAKRFEMNDANISTLLKNRGRMGTRPQRAHARSIDPSIVEGLIRSGLTYTEIGARLKISRAHARRLLIRALNERGETLSVTPPKRLDAGTVADIRRRRGDGDTFAGIAAHYGLSIATVHVIVNRKTWKHVP